MQKNATAVRAIHGETGLVAVCQSERSLGRNKAEALKALMARVADAANAEANRRMNGTRRSQIGTGYRGDKIRTVQVQNGVVTNHLTGRKCSLRQYLKGDIEAVQ